MNIAAKPKSAAAETPEFELRSGDLLKQIKKSGGPVFLTRKGRAAAVAIDVKSYRQMRAQIDQLNDIVAIGRGLDAAERGAVRPWELAEADMRKKLGLPRRRYRTGRG